MTGFTFPRLEIHNVEINGRKFVMGPFAGAFLSTDSFGADLLQNCEGRTVEECKQWTQGRYGEGYVPIVEEFARLVDNGFFSPPDVAAMQDATTELPAINTVTICLTHACQLACRYCFAKGARENPESNDMTLDTARAAIRFVIEESKRSGIDAVAINYNSTGEALLRKDLMVEVTRYARQQAQAAGIWFPFGFGTNGLLLDPVTIEEMKDAGINFAMSWDGPPEIHDMNRVRPDGSGTYDDVARAFRAVTEHGWQIPFACGAHIPASDTNIVGRFRHLYDMGVRVIAMKPIRDGGSGMGVSESTLPAYKAGYADLVEHLLQTDAYHTERLCSLQMIDYFWRFVRKIALREPSIHRCSSAMTSICIDTNGDIYPCQDFVGMPQYRLGDVFTGMNDDLRKLYIQGLVCDKMEPCQSCWARYWCGGGCHSQSANAMGALGIPYPPDCELTKYLLELAAYFVAKLNDERPSLLWHVLDFGNPTQTPDPRPVARCHRASERDLWYRPVGDWRSPDPILLCDASQSGGYKVWRGPYDLSATVHLRWDDQHLYVFAEVRGSAFVPAPRVDSEWWFYDSLQIALDPHNDGGVSVDPWRLTGGDREFGIASIGGRTQCFDCHDDRSKPTRSWRGIAEVRGGMTLYRMAIPWKCVPDFIPAVGAECGFTVVVNDCDRSGRGWLQWTPGLTALRNPGAFGLLRLA